MIDKEFELASEIFLLKNKISYVTGSLESVRYLLSEDNVTNEKTIDLEHIRSIVNRVLENITDNSIN